MRYIVVTLCFVLSMAVGFTAVVAQNSSGDACANVELGPDEVGLDYQGHCIVPDETKGPVQGIFVRRVEDLDGVTIQGIVLIKTANGWVIAKEEFVEQVTGDFATVAVEDGWHMALDEME